MKEVTLVELTGAIRDMVTTFWQVKSQQDMLKEIEHEVLIDVIKANFPKVQTHDYLIEFHADDSGGLGCTVTCHRGEGNWFEQTKSVQQYCAGLLCLVTQQRKLSQSDYTDEQLRLIRDELTGILGGEDTLIVRVGKRGLVKVTLSGGRLSFEKGD